MTSADESRTRVYRVRIGDAVDAGEAEAAEPAMVCLRGAIAAGFSLVVSAGGSVDDLEACAEGRQLTALYILDGGAWVSYILGAPVFVNSAFAELLTDGVPALTPLVARSDGPATADPAGEAGLPPAWPECLRGDIATGFSLLLYAGGSVDDLEACAQSLDLDALYTLHEGAYVSYIPGAPDFVNEAFGALFAEGIAPVTR